VKVAVDTGVLVGGTRVFVEVAVGVGVLMAVNEAVGVFVGGTGVLVLVNVAVLMGGTGVEVLVRIGVGVKEAVPLTVKVEEAIGVEEEAAFGVIVTVGDWVGKFVGLLVPVGVPVTTKLFAAVGVLLGSEVCPVVGWIEAVGF
jgi:hypothetical protein